MNQKRQIQKDVATNYYKSGVVTLQYTQKHKEGILM